MYLWRARASPWSLWATSSGRYRPHTHDRALIRPNRRMQTINLAQKRPVCHGKAVETMGGSVAKSVHTAIDTHIAERLYVRRARAPPVGDVARSGARMFGIGMCSSSRRTFVTVTSGRKSAGAEISSVKGGEEHGHRDEGSDQANIYHGQLLKDSRTKTTDINDKPFNGDSNRSSHLKDVAASGIGGAEDGFSLVDVDYGWEDPFFEDTQDESISKNLTQESAKIEKSQSSQSDREGIAEGRNIGQLDSVHRGIVDISSVSIFGKNDGGLIQSVQRKTFMEASSTHFNYFLFEDLLCKLKSDNLKAYTSVISICTHLEDLYVADLSRHNHDLKEAYQANVIAPFNLLALEEIPVFTRQFYESLLKVGLRLWALDMGMTRKIISDISSNRRMTITGGDSSYEEGAYNLNWCPDNIIILYMSCAVRHGDVNLANTIFEDLSRRSIYPTIMDKALMNMVLLNCKYNKQGEAESYFNKMLKRDTVLGIYLLHSLSAMFIMYNRAREFTLANAKIDQIEEFLSRISQLPEGQRVSLLFGEMNHSEISGKTQSIIAKSQKVELQRIFTMALDTVVKRNNIVKMKNLLHIMTKLDVEPSNAILECEMRAYSNMKSIAGCESVLTKIRLFGRKPTLEIYVKLMGIYSRLNDYDATEKLFKRIQNTKGMNPDIRCWNILLLACSRSFKPAMVQQKYLEMLKSNVKPDAQTLSILIQSFLDSGEFDKAIKYLNQVNNFSTLDSSSVYNVSGIDIQNKVINIGPRSVKSRSHMSGQSVGQDPSIGAVTMESQMDSGEIDLTRMVALVKAIEGTGGKLSQRLILCIVSSLLGRNKFQAACSLISQYQQKQRLPSSMYLQLFKHSRRLQDEDHDWDIVDFKEIIESFTPEAIIYQCLRYSDNWDNRTSEVFLSYALENGYLPLSVEIYNALIMMGKPISHKQSAYLIYQLRKWLLVKHENNEKINELIVEHNQLLEKLNDSKEHAKSDKVRTPIKDEHKLNSVSPLNTRMKEVQDQLKQLNLENDSLPELSRVDPYTAVKTIYNYVRRSTAVSQGISIDDMTSDSNSFTDSEFNSIRNRKYQGGDKFNNSDLDLGGSKLYAEMIEFEFAWQYTKRKSPGKKGDSDAVQTNKESWESCLEDISEVVLHVFEDRGIIDLEIDDLGLNPISTDLLQNLTSKKLKSDGDYRQSTPNYGIGPSQSKHGNESALTPHAYKLLITDILKSDNQIKQWSNETETFVFNEIEHLNKGLKKLGHFKPNTLDGNKDTAMSLPTGDTSFTKDIFKTASLEAQSRGPQDWMSQRTVDPQVLQDIVSFCIVRIACWKGRK